MQTTSLDHQFSNTSPRVTRPSKKGDVMSTMKCVTLATVAGFALAAHAVYRQREVIRLYLDACGLSPHEQQPLLPESIEARYYAASISSNTDTVSPLNNKEIRRMIRNDFAAQVLLVAEQELRDEKTAERNEREQRDAWRELPGAS